MAIAGALVAPTAAQAAPPADLAVSQADYQLTATWTLPAGMASEFIEFSQSSDLSNPFVTDRLQPADTGYTSAPLDPGTYYVRVGAFPDPCGTPCTTELSEIAAVTIPPPAPPTLVSVGQANRHLTASWTLAPGTESVFIEAAVAPDTYPEGDFPIENTVLFEFLDFDQTTFTSPSRLPPGTYYVHVASYAPACPALGCSLDLFSETLPVTIPPDPAPPAQPVPPAPPLDKVTSFATLKCAATQRAGRLVVQASMPENGTITVGGTVSVPNASKVFRVKAVTVTALAGKAMKITVKLPRRALKAARMALKRHRKVRAKLTITARDGAGNRRIEKRTVKLRP